MSCLTCARRLAERCGAIRVHVRVGLPDSEAHGGDVANGQRPRADALRDVLVLRK